ncbi:hypothetical protein BH24ACI2_BH24ACI2_10240 [soil metagenome]|jgi:hypothetical protein|nr:hypothetical protein [Acidobacteriota bacterium]
MKKFTFRGTLRYEYIQLNHFVVYDETEEKASNRLKRFDWDDPPRELEFEFGETLCEEVEEIELYDVEEAE